MKTPSGCPTETTEIRGRRRNCFLHQNGGRRHRTDLPTHRDRRSHPQTLPPSGRHPAGCLSPDLGPSHRLPNHCYCCHLSLRLSPESLCPRHPASDRPLTVALTVSFTGIRLIRSPSSRAGSAGFPACLLQTPTARLSPPPRWSSLPAASPPSSLVWSLL